MAGLIIKKGATRILSGSRPVSTTGADLRPSQPYLEIEADKEPRLKDTS